MEFTLTPTETNVRDLLRMAAISPEGLRASGLREFVVQALMEADDRTIARAALALVLDGMRAGLAALETEADLLAIEALRDRGGLH